MYSIIFPDQNKNGGYKPNTVHQSMFTFFKWDMVAYNCYHCTGSPGRLLRVQGHPGLYREVQTSLAKL